MEIPSPHWFYDRLLNPTTEELELAKRGGEQLAAAMMLHETKAATEARATRRAERRSIGRKR